MTVDQFEALVLSQKPADKPWEPTAAVPYDFESRKIAEGIHPQLIWRYLVPCSDADVLDYGCGPSGHLVRLLKETRSRADEQVTIVGYDPQADESLGLTRCVPTMKAVWDLVICREVLEHLTILQIRRAVTNLCGLSSRFCYVTTRFLCDKPGWHRVRYGHDLLDVDTSDDLDPTHISMLSKDLLRVLFVLEGFKRRADLEEKMDHMKKGRVLVYERV